MNKVKKLTLALTTTALLTLLTIPACYAATGTITVDTLRVRKAPSTSSDILRNLDEGDKVEVIEKENDWYKVKLADGKEAYIYAEYVKLEENLTTNEGKKPQQTEENTKKEDFKLEKNTRIYILPLLFSNEISKVTEDTTVKVVEKINNWVCVEYNGVTGWVLSKGTVAETPAEKPAEPTTKTGYVNVSSAYVRKDGSKSAEILTSLNLNNEVTILNEKDGWYEIKLSNGTGYIFAELVSDKKTEVTSRSSISRTANATTKTTTQTETKKQTTTTKKTAQSATGTASAKAQDVVSFAKKYVGYKYVYGGSGPTSFDCSGFTMYVFKQYGVSLPHNARTQSNYGKYVSRSNLQPGDLLIFNNYANNSIGHAGIYIGNGKFVHAANSKSGVIISSMDSGYYSARFVEGRRLV